MDAAMQKDINALISKLGRLEGVITKNIKADLRVAAAPLVTAIKAATPVSSKIHKRYRKGAVVATYRPGNLRRSFRVLPLRRAKRSVVVGPIARGKMPDGFYARFIEFGTQNITARHFVRRATDAALPGAQKIIINLLKERIENFAITNLGLR